MSIHGEAVADYWAAVSLVFLAVGSGLYHATNLRSHQAMDEAAMYVAFCALAGAGLVHVFGYDGPITFFAAAIGIYMGTKLEVLDSFKWVPVTVLVALTPVFLHDARVSGALLLFYLVCVAIRSLGKYLMRVTGKHIYDDVLHGIWHLATASAIYVTWAATLAA